MECVFACQTLAYFDESDSLFLFVKQYLLALPASFLPRAQREAALLRTFYNHCFPLPSNISSVTAVAELFSSSLLPLARSLGEVFCLFVFVFSLFFLEKESRVFPRIIVNKVR